MVTLILIYVGGLSPIYVCHRSVTFFSGLPCSACTVFFTSTLNIKGVDVEITKLYFLRSELQQA